MHPSTATLRRLWLLLGSIFALLRDTLAWWPWVEQPITQEEQPLNYTVLFGEEAGDEWLRGSLHRGGDVAQAREEPDDHGTGGLHAPPLPPRWNSSVCMARWGLPELQSRVDPGGYLVFSEGREQLGNNRFLLSDGFVIAKSLNRTLVEFPMKDSRIATPDAELGFCSYWDCERLCSYHRILDLYAFRSMLRYGQVSTEDFVTVLSADHEKTLLPKLVTADNITNFFAEYANWPVIVMKMAWKSAIRREPVDLLRPHPLYLDLTGYLIGTQKGWDDGRFMAVQWRTETSTGNLTECYRLQVRPVVEQQRVALGFSRRQVFFNVDLVGQASTTYNASEVLRNQRVVEGIREDYPVAMNNTVYDYLGSRQDAGVKAMVSGMISASADFFLASSFNGSGSDECQKPHSKYIDLVAEWRLSVVGKNLTSFGRLLPSVQQEEKEMGLAWCIVGIIAILLSLCAWARKANVDKSPQSKKMP